MRPLILLPARGLPPSGYPANQTTEWFIGDNRRTYNEHGGHSIYGPKDITYTFNHLGYRCAEFDQTADLRVLAIGCSYVLGTGLPARALFHERFAARLRTTARRSVIVWNLGNVGASNDYITRMLALGLRELNPDIVLVHFTHLPRREYLSASHERVNYTPMAASDDPVHSAILSHFRALGSKPDDLLNLFRNYKAIEAMLRGRIWFYSLTDPVRAESIIQQFDQERYCGELQQLDHARDHLHPGPASHEVLFESYWRRFLALGGGEINL